MGQVFDRDGNVLGEAEGDSMREVFDKLTQEHKNADEIRVKAMKDKEAFVAGATTAPNVMADRMMQFFAYAHLPEPLQAVSRPFCDLAATVVATLPSNPERTVALRKLLEAKDCAVRALLFK
jgi:ferritin-like protein